MIHIPFGHANSLACENSITIMGTFFLPSRWYVLIMKWTGFQKRRRPLLIFPLNKLNKNLKIAIALMVISQEIHLLPSTFFQVWLFLTGCSLWMSYSDLLFFSVEAITSLMMLQGWYPQQKEPVTQWCPMLHTSPLFLLCMINHSLFLFASFIFATQILYLKTLKQTRATDPGATPQLRVAPGFGQRLHVHLPKPRKTSLYHWFFKKFSKLSERSGLSKANIPHKKSSSDFLCVCQGKANLRAFLKPHNRGGFYHSLLKNYHSSKTSNRLPF